MADERMAAAKRPLSVMPSVSFKAGVVQSSRMFSLTDWFGFTWKGLK